MTTHLTHRGGPLAVGGPATAARPHDQTGNPGRRDRLSGAVVVAGDWTHQAAHGPAYSVRLPAQKERAHAATPGECDAPCW